MAVLKSLLLVLCALLVGIDAKRFSPEARSLVASTRSLAMGKGMARDPYAAWGWPRLRRGCGGTASRDGARALAFVCRYGGAD